MALAGKYGKLNIPKIPDNEPVFVLRAQDVLAVTAIKMYRLLAASHGRPVTGDMDQAIEAFNSWTGTKKPPD